MIAQNVQAGAAPFPHVVMEKWANPSIVRNLNEEWPENGWITHSHAHSQKRGCSDWARFGEATRRNIHALNRPEFVNYLSDLFSIPDLTPDMQLYGGGLHEALAGGFLDIHADFNVHPHTGLIRRLNLLLFLNDVWLEEWDGNLELWDAERCVVSVPPVGGTCVIFATSERSFHGHPRPLGCPSYLSRRSLALYYYSPQMPGEPVRKHGTLYRGSEARWYEEKR